MPEVEPMSGDMSDDMSRAMEPIVLEEEDEATPHCTAPDAPEEEGIGESRTRGGPLPNVNTQLPNGGTGFYSYAGNRGKQFGRRETIEAIEAIGQAWMRDHPNPPLIGVGNISFRGGGTMPPHSSHKRGVDVDFRPLRIDGARSPVTFRDAAYSRSRTAELVRYIRNNGVLPVRLILFNDTNIEGVQHWPGHDNHLHVRFEEP